MTTTAIVEDDRITLEFFPVSKMKVAKSNPRIGLDAPLFVPGWDDRLAGTLDVRTYGNGGPIGVMDGRTRLVNARTANVTALPCRVHWYLTDEEDGSPLEYEIAGKLNRIRAGLRPFESFMNRVNAHEPRAIEIKNIVERHGLKLGGSGGPSYVRSPHALEVLLLGGVLDPVLGIALEAWGKTTATVKVPSLTAIGSFLMAHPNADRARLIQVLQLIPPNRLIGRIKDRKEAIPDELGAIGALRVVEGLYNSRLTEARRLPEGKLPKIGHPKGDPGMVYPRSGARIGTRLTQSVWR